MYYKVSSLYFWQECNESYDNELYINLHSSLVRNGDTIFVRVGDYDLATQYGSNGAQTQRVSTTYIHHNHNGQTLDNGNDK